MALPITHILNDKQTYCLRDNIKDHALDIDCVDE